MYKIQGWSTIRLQASNVLKYPTYTFLSTFLLQVIVVQEVDSKPAVGVSLPVTLKCF